MSVRPVGVGKGQGSYKVYNQASGNEYEVSKFNGRLFCDCKAFEFAPNKKVPCKHMWAVLSWVKEQRVKKEEKIEEALKAERVVNFPLVENPTEYDRVEVNNWKNFFREANWTSLKIKAERERAIEKALAKPDTFYNNIIVACNEATERKVA